MRHEKDMAHANGEPYQVGDLVRYKLNDDVRSRSYGGKIAPRYSEPYLIVGVKNEFTYAIKPAEGSSRGRPKVRHFNQLKTVQRTQQRCDTSGNTDSVSDTPPDDIGVTSVGDEEVTDETEVQSEGVQDVISAPHNVGTRWSTRQKKKTSFLQADGHRKTYV